MSSNRNRLKKERKGEGLQKTESKIMNQLKEFYQLEE